MEAARPVDAQNGPTGLCKNYTVLHKLPRALIVMSPSEERKSQPSDHWVIDPQIAAEEAIKGPQRRRLMPVSPNSLGHRLVQQLPIEARRLPNDCDAAFGALRSRLDNLLPRSRFYTKAKGFASSFSGFWPRCPAG